MRWSIRIEAAAPGVSAPDNDALFDLLEYLEPFDASVTGTPEEATDGMARYGVRMAIDEDEAAAASSRAINEFTTGVEKAHLPDWPIVSFAMMREAELEAEVDVPNFPELLGITELADLLGVSRQRASALARGSTFPLPVARLHAGPVWTQPSVRRFVEGWGRKPGRPSKQQA